MAEIDRAIPSVPGKMTDLAGVCRDVRLMPRYLEPEGEWSAQRWRTIVVSSKQN